MANEVKYKNPLGIRTYEVDFTNILPDDAALHGVNSEVAAVDSEGEDISADLIGTVTISGMVLSFICNESDDKEDYLITVIGVGTTTNDSETYTIELRSRATIDGAV